jgi:hypothetical protein
MIQSTDKFIVTPKGGSHFVNERKVGGQMMVVNTSIENAKDVNREAIIVSLPLDYSGNIQVGDEVIVQHNIFRDYFDMKMVTRKSTFHIKDNLFLVPDGLIYLIKKENGYEAVDDYCFIEPIFEEKRWEGKVELEHLGIVKYGNKHLENSGIKEGDKIAFEKDGEYEFIIDDLRLYRMRAEMILAKVMV